jgi:hypothetical protein
MGRRISSSQRNKLLQKKLYQVLPNESAAKDDYIRIIDESGEDYLYPASYFILIELATLVSRQNDYEEILRVGVAKAASLLQTRKSIGSIAAYYLQIRMRCPMPICVSMQKSLALIWIDFPRI